MQWPNPFKSSVRLRAAPVFVDEKRLMNRVMRSIGLATREGWLGSLRLQ